MIRFRKSALVAVPLLGLVLTAQTARAGVCDLSVAGSTCDPLTFGGVYYTNVLPSGTFTVDPFLQLKTSSNTVLTEQGYNTGGTLQFDTSGTTHALALSDVPIVTIGTTQYREFFLNIDEKGNNTTLSLDKLQIFLSDSSNLTNYSAGTLGGNLAVYDLDAGTDNWIKLDYRVGKSSGPGAMIVYVPDYLFTQSGAQYVYVYSQFGTNLAADGGLEEWWIRTNGAGRSVTRVPEPTLLLLFGAATLLVGNRLRKLLL